jgi:hypothetical protein
MGAADRESVANGITVTDPLIIPTLLIKDEL